MRTDRQDCGLRRSPFKRAALLGLLTSSLAAAALPAQAEWDKAYRDNFISGCVKSTEPSGDIQRTTRTCTCMEQHLESRLSEQRMIELSKMTESQEKQAALSPLLQEAKAKCEGAR